MSVNGSISPFVCIAREEEKVKLSFLGCGRRLTLFYESIGVRVLSTSICNVKKAGKLNKLLHERFNIVIEPNPLNRWSAVSGRCSSACEQFVRLMNIGKRGAKGRSSDKISISIRDFCKHSCEMS